MEHLADDYEDNTNHDKDSDKLRNETVHPILSLMKWKLGQPHY